MAFLLKEYVELIETLKRKGYELAPVRHYSPYISVPIVFLRHDVDRIPSRALMMAKTEHELGVMATYYFRFPFPSQMKEISKLGHEIGFHYENGNLKEGLKELRKIVPVRTITAHFQSIGIPVNYPFEELDVFDPMREIDFSKCLYVTDSGGIFGSKANLKDWAEPRFYVQNLMIPTCPWFLGEMLTPEYRPMVLLSCHPERWAESKLGYIQAELMDKVINCAKHYLKISTETTGDSKT